MVEYFEQTLEKFISTGKNVCVMVDFNLCLLKSEVLEFSHIFLLSLQSCYLIPTIDKPSRVHGNSASLIDNIFLIEHFESAGEKYASKIPASGDYRDFL